MTTDDGQWDSAPIDNGQYSLQRAPVGQAHVTVTGRLTPPPADLYARVTEADKARARAGKEATEPEVEDPDAVPRKYSTDKTSGLTFQVLPGSHEYNLDLEPGAANSSAKPSASVKQQPKSNAATKKPDESKAPAQNAKR